MSDVDEIVDLRAATDAGFIERASIDGCIRANFHVSFDHQTAGLGKLLVMSSFAITHISKAVAPENSPGMHNDAVADRGSRIYRHPRIDFAIPSDADS